MIVKPPRIILAPRSAECRSNIDWDKDSLTFSLLIRCSEKSTRGCIPKLSGILDERFNIDQGEYRLMLGDAVILLDKNRQITSFEIRADPTAWKHRILPPIPRDLPSMSVDFVVDYDENRIASYDLTIQIANDKSRRELAFCFGGLAVSRWALVAEGFVVGMTSDYYLSEFRVVGYEATTA